jgi:hypothetical protein
MRLGARAGGRWRALCTGSTCIPSTVPTARPLNVQSNVGRVCPAIHSDPTLLGMRRWTYISGATSAASGSSPSSAQWPPWTEAPTRKLVLISSSTSSAPCSSASRRSPEVRKQGSQPRGSLCGAQQAEGRREVRMVPTDRAQTLASATLWRPSMDNSRLQQRSQHSRRLEQPARPAPIPDVDRSSLLNHTAQNMHAHFLGRILNGPKTANMLCAPNRCSGSPPRYRCSPSLTRPCPLAATVVHRGMPSRAPRVRRDGPLP